MLADTLSQTVPLSKPFAVANLGASMFYATGLTLGAYHASGGDVAVTTLVGLYQYLGEVPGLVVKSRAIMEVSGRWENQKSLQKVANLDGVERIHVFTAGYAKYWTVIPNQLHTNSLVLIEADNDHLPAVLGSHWIHVKKDGDAKVRLELRIQGAATAGYLEIPIHEFIQGTTLSEPIKKEWKAEISKWKKQLPFWKRHVSTKKFSQEVSIVGTLIYDGKEKPLGEMAAGGATKKILNEGMIRSALGWIKSHVANFEEDKSQKFTRKIDVLDLEEAPSACAARIRKLLGTAIIRKVD